MNRDVKLYVVANVTAGNRVCSTCPFCSNDSYVTLDSNNTVVPCPMCRLGKIKEIGCGEVFDGKALAARALPGMGFWGRMPSDAQAMVEFDGGKTVLWYVCTECTKKNGGESVLVPPGDCDHKIGEPFVAPRLHSPIAKLSREEEAALIAVNNDVVIV